MLDLYRENNKIIIKVSEFEKILMTEKDFIVQGDINDVGVKFASHVNESINYYFSQYPFTNKPFVIESDGYGYFELFSLKLGNFQFIVKEDNRNNLKADIIWYGEESEDLLKFKKVINRYFNMKCFL